MVPDRGRADGAALLPQVVKLAHRVRVAIVVLALAACLILAGAETLAMASTSSPPPQGSTAGLSVGTLVLAVIAALFLGGFVGNLRASNRWRPSKISVYAVIEERLREGKEP
jgi:hypothetical protein